MDYFKELLESFSRVKGRKLRILEGQFSELSSDAGAESEAAALINNAQNSPMAKPMTTTTSSGNKVGVFMKNLSKPNETNIPKGGLVGADGTVLGGDKQFDLSTPDGRKQFVALFMEEGSSKKKPKPEPGQTLMGRLKSFFKNLTADTAESIQKSFINISDTLKNNKERFNALAESAGLTPARALNYFTGGANTSLESRLSNLSFKLAYKDGELVKVTNKPKAKDRMKVISKLEDLVSLAMGEKLRAGSEECVALVNGFAMMGGDNSRYLVVAMDADTKDNDSVAISDSKGIYEKTLRQAYKQCSKQKDPEEISVHSDAVGGANANRGFSFEEVPLVIGLTNLLREVLETKPIDEAAEKCLTEQLETATKNLTKKLRRLSDDTESWTEEEKTTALDIVDTATLEMAKALVSTPGKGDFTERLVQSMIPFGRNIRSRGSVLALPAGGETGQGKRQDVLEVYDNCEDAKEAIRKSGKDIGAEPVSKKISDLSSDHQKVLACAGKEKLSGLDKDKNGDDGEVCVVNTSLKNYVGIDRGVTSGSQRGGSQRDTANVVDRFLKGTLIFGPNLSKDEEKKVESLEAKEKALQDKMAKLKDKSEKLTGEARIKAESERSKLQKEAKKIRAAVRKLEAKENPEKILADHIVEAEKSYKEQLGLSDEEHKAAADLIKELSDINGAIITNPTVDVDVDGKTETHQMFDTTGKIVQETLLDKIGHPKDFPDVDALLNVIKAYEDDPSEKARRKVALFVEKQALMNKINSGDPEQAKIAINALKLKAMRVGGDSSNVLGLEIRDISDGNIYGFKHNKPLEEAFANLGEEGSEWQIDPGQEGSSHITIKGPDGAHIKLEAKVIRTSSGAYKNVYSVHYNKQLIQKYNLDADTPTEVLPESVIYTAIDLIWKTLSRLREKVGISNL